LVHFKCFFDFFDNSESRYKKKKTCSVRPFDSEEGKAALNSMMEKLDNAISAEETMKHRANGPKKNGEKNRDITSITIPATNMKDALIALRTEQEKSDWCVRRGFLCSKHPYSLMRVDFRDRGMAKRLFQFCMVSQKERNQSGQEAAAAVLTREDKNTKKCGDKKGPFSKGIVALLGFEHAEGMLAEFRRNTNFL